MLCLCFSVAALLGGRSVGWRSDTHCTDERQVQDGAQDRYSSDEAYDDWEEAPGRENVNKEGHG